MRPAVNWRLVSLRLAEELGVRAFTTRRIRKGVTPAGDRFAEVRKTPRTWIAWATRKVRKP